MKWKKSQKRCGNLKPHLFCSKKKYKKIYMNKEIIKGGQGCGEF